MESGKEPIDVNEFSRNCKRVLFEYVMEKEGIDNKKQHLRTIWTKTCRNLFDELPSKWQIFAAIISDKGDKRCYVKFVKYVASLDSNYNPDRPLKEQLKIEGYEPVLDLYSSVGKEMGIRGLENLAVELKEKYSNSSIY